MKVPYGYLKRQYNAKRAEYIWRKFVKPVVTRGDFTLGKEVHKFEDKLCKFTGSKYSLGVADGTNALILGLKALNVGKGDEVLVPSLTFIASAAVISLVGATPVFCPVNNKFVIDENWLEEAITKKTKAIMAVHYQGQPCNMKKIMAIARKHNLAVVEDTAQALGASIDGKACGTFGDVAGISFHPQKNMNCWGDGGAVLTQSKECYTFIKRFRNHGGFVRDQHDIVGSNSRLDTTNAAVLLHDIGHLKAHNKRRAQIAKRYDTEIKGIVLTPRNKNEVHTYHLYMSRVPALERNSLLDHLRRRGVDAKIHYPKPLYANPAFKNVRHRVVKKQEIIHDQLISFPIHQFMTDKEVDYVIKSVNKFYEG